MYTTQLSVQEWEQGLSLDGLDHIYTFALLPLSRVTEQNSVWCQFNIS